MKPQLQIFVFSLIVTLGLYFKPVSSQYTEFYGTTPNGGEYSQGTIFKTDGYGNNFQVVYNFQPSYSASAPVGLCESNNGKLYGMTASGGTYNQGILFEWDPDSNIFINKLDFNGLDNGAYPKGSLLLANDGMFYGMTEYGGVHNEGVLFKWDPVTNIFSKKLDFNGAENGKQPIGSLMQANNGKLYGMTACGGTDNHGVLFEWDPATDTYAKKFDFSNYESGRCPKSSLVQVENGKFYGMTGMGGTNDLGTLFEWDPSTNIYTKKMDFSNETGRYPDGSLMLASNGKLYGATSGGPGNTYCGAIFEWDPSSNFYTIKYEFLYTDRWLKGGTPLSSLIQYKNGKIYGVTTGGSTRQVLFELDPDNDSYNVMYDFSELKGRYPNFLMQASNDKIYVTTQMGAENEHGAIFEYNPDSNLCTKKFGFTGNDDGVCPYGSLTQANNGRLYGMTSGGGANGQGVLFEFDQVTHTYTKKYDVDFAHGYYSSYNLMKGENGILYGFHNGSNSNPVKPSILFEWDPATDTYSINHEFGEAKIGSLIEGYNGKLYGLGNGIVIEFDPETETFIRKDSLNRSIFGEWPKGSLVRAHDGKFFGISYSNEQRNIYGTLFKWDTVTNVKTKLADLHQYGAYNSTEQIIMADNGILYGLSSFGRNYGIFVVFEYDDVHDSCIEKHRLNEYVQGNVFFGPLLQAKNGKLYGLNSRGGSTNNGVLFEWDPAFDTYTKKIDFGNVRGSNPGGSLIEVKFRNLVTDVDGNGYKTVVIGNQKWMTENLKTSRLNDGTAIPLIQNNTEWSGLNQQAYCWYRNDSANKEIFGALYNYYTVETKKLCPVGWHVPDDSEWYALNKFLGDSSVGNKLKESGFEHWPYPNAGAGNSSEFTALPGGMRSDYGGFIENNMAAWWSANSLQYWYVTANNADFMNYGIAPRGGVSVRCINDTLYTTAPRVTTFAVNKIGKDSAISGGRIVFDGGSSITQRGICWGTSNNPVITGNKTIEGNGPNDFISNIKGLIPNTVYYIRAYAINNAGIGYGNELCFTTIPDIDFGTITDIDGNVYKTVKIGNQIWMAENLRTTKYADDTPLKDGTLTNFGCQDDNSYFVYGNNRDYKDNYGLLYNWYAAVYNKNFNSYPLIKINQGVCPSGWHLPSRDEFGELLDYLGGKNVAGGKLKETGFMHWNQPNAGATNESGFTARGGGGRPNECPDGVPVGDAGLSTVASFWTSDSYTHGDYSFAYGLYLSSKDSLAHLSSWPFRKGCSVRCIQDQVETIDLIKGLIAYYPFNGNANDESGHNHNGVIDGATLTEDRFGNPNSAYSFNGQGNSIIIDSFNLPSDSVSISCWVNQVSSKSLKQNFISKYNNTGDVELLMRSIHRGYYIEWNIGGNYFYLMDRNYFIIDPEHPGYTFLVLTYNGQRVDFYINSTLVDSKIISGQIAHNDQPMVFGKYAGNSPGIAEYFNGILDDIRIYNRALTKTEIRALLYTSDIIPMHPRANDVSVCEGQQVPGLTAVGENIRWFGDAQLTNLLHEGNTFATGQTAPGTYTFYLTQIIDTLESLPDTVTLTIKPNPPKPFVQDATFCAKDIQMNLKATGENIKWYAMPDSLSDSRDGKKYNTVRIGNHVWMADNLDVGAQLAGSLDQTDNQVIEKYCYDDNPANCTQYGGLYQWNELMNYPTSESNQGICPAGWHIPSNNEWIELETALGMDPSVANSFGFRGTDQGSKLLAGGSSGFNALLAGKRTPVGTFVSLDSYCTFWNSSTANRTLSLQFPEIYASDADDKSNGFSLRCVCDDSSVIATGNTFNPGITKPGTYSFQVSQTINGCESSVDTAALTVSPVPSSPVTNNITICEGDSVPDLSAEGENIQWYSDTALTNLIESGNSFTSVQTLPGKYIYYVTQTIAACESDTESITLTINPMPVINLGADTTIYTDQNFILGPFTDDYNYLWNDGSESPYFEISGSDLGLGNHHVVVIVSDLNGCNNSDTVTISVMPYSDIHYYKDNSPIRLFPNPTNGSFTIDLDKTYSNVYIVINKFDSRIIQTENYNNVKTINLKMDAEPGIYLVTITTVNDKAVFKIMKK